MGKSWSGPKLSHPTIPNSLQCSDFGKYSLHVFDLDLLPSDAWFMVNVGKYIPYMDCMGTNPANCTPSLVFCPDCCFYSIFNGRAKPANATSLSWASRSMDSPSFHWGSHMDHHSQKLPHNCKQHTIKVSVWFNISTIILPIDANMLV